MQTNEILTLLLSFAGLVAGVLGILLKGEYDKRVALQQQLSEKKREAYASFNKTINDLLTALTQKNPQKDLGYTIKQLTEHRPGIWQYGSDDVIKAYALWQQCIFASNDTNGLSSASTVLMADLIVEMRKDFGLSKGDSLTSLDILRVFVNDIEDKYDEMVGIAKKFEQDLGKTKHLKL